LNYQKYRPMPVLDYREREWPNRQITKAPDWCSVDLRDGNQALIQPMNVDEKMEMFNLLLKLGFKEIEIGFPAASQIEYDFLRELVARDMIPDDVTVQILCQCREHLIERSFEAIEGIKNVVFHIYNSTSTLQREVVFHMSREEIKQIAIDGTRMVKERAKNFPGNLRLEYSPESFSGTEVEFSLECCQAVQDVWEPTPENPIIFNLPNTVEQTTPNVYADQIEWMDRHFKNRDCIILSVHPHNDRGCGVAATELALLAGADRVEGTLLGNGERTGNVDILTVAYNMFSQGIDPGLHLENINEIIDVYERCCKMEIDMRHPYAGQLVFTAFSGSHQDAINKGMHAMEEKNNGLWEIPYLPIDPADIGRQYEPVVRINSQSGKGGVAFVMESLYGFKLPKAMQGEFASVIQKISEKQGGEISPDEIFAEFKRQYIAKTYPFEFLKFRVEDIDDKTCMAWLVFKHNGQEVYAESQGNGPLDAIKKALKTKVDLDITILDYSEHTMSEGSDARAAAYVQLRDNRTGKTIFGAGDSSNITKAVIRAFFSALDRLFAEGV